MPYAIKYSVWKGSNPPVKMTDVLRRCLELLVIEMMQDVFNSVTRIRSYDQ